MLDDLEVINVLDPSNMLDSAHNSWKQLRHKFGVNLKHINASAINNVVFMGMGGSALAAVIFESWQRGELKIPFSYFREYDVPGWVGSSTLVIVSSYSGNTEEEVSALIHAREKGAQIIVMADGGHIFDEALRYKYPLYEIPQASQPRMAVFYMVRALSEVFEYFGFGQNLVSGLESAAKGLKSSTVGWRADVDTEYNYAKQLALKIKDKHAVIMGGPLMAAAAYKWKIGINETAKHMAFYSVWPEFNHNEFLGWSHTPETKPYVIFQIVSDFESERIHKRYTISNKLLEKKIPEPIVIVAYGQSDIEQLLWAISLGDHVSTYLALLNGVNPTPVDLIEQLKEELNK